MSDTRSELVAQAENLIRSRGYSGFSYADLSQRVGIRKASIHHHFPTKEKLAVAVLEAYRNRYKNALVQIERDCGHALDRIDAYGRLYLAGIDKGQGCLCAALASELEILPTELKTGSEAFFREHLDWIGQIYAQGLETNQVNENLSDSEAGRLVLNALEGALMMERLLDGNPGFMTTLVAIRNCLQPS